MDETEYALPPGETLREWAQEHGVNDRELAQRLGVNAPTLHRLLIGTEPVTDKAAQRLERETHTPTRMWISLEHLYRQDLHRLFYASSAKQRRFPS